jgi:hypothetical protein
MIFRRSGPGSEPSRRCRGRTCGWPARTGGQVQDPFALDPGQFLDRENPVVLVRHVSGISSSSGYFTAVGTPVGGRAAAGRMTITVRPPEGMRSQRSVAWTPVFTLGGGCPARRSWQVSVHRSWGASATDRDPAHGTFGPAARTCFRICLLTFGASAGTYARCMDDLGLVGLPHVHRRGDPADCLLQPGPGQSAACRLAA